MKMGIYPGSFDPFTCGHLDIVHRALHVVEKLVVAVAINVRKTPAFTVEERLEMIRDSVLGVKGVEVDAFSGLLVDYAKQKRARIIIRGLRALSDFENEFQMAHMNRRLAPDLETIFMMTSQEHFYISSQTVKEVAYFGGDIRNVVPDAVRAKLQQKGVDSKDKI